MLLAVISVLCLLRFAGCTSGLSKDTYSTTDCKGKWESGEPGRIHSVWTTLNYCHCFTDILGGAHCAIVVEEQNRFFQYVYANLELCEAHSGSQQSRFALSEYDNLGDCQAGLGDTSYKTKKYGLFSQWGDTRTADRDGLDYARMTYSKEDCKGKVLSAEIWRDDQILAAGCIVHDPGYEICATTGSTSLVGGESAKTGCGTQPWASYDTNALAVSLVLIILGAVIAVIIIVVVVVFIVLKRRK